MNTETIAFTDRGRIAIPSAIRRKFGIQDGTRAAITATANGIVLRPITRDYIRSLRGSLKGKGVLKALMANRERERTH
jgi:AbrB family looped-hinge helix DNA binding protein